MPGVAAGHDERHFCRLIVARRTADASLAASG